MTWETTPPFDRLAEIIRSRPDLAVAVSGGVDSLTLAHSINKIAGRVHAYHAVSPAVPRDATERVRRHAASPGWVLRIIEAGEFSDPDYLRNPVNRCYFCKVNLYDRVADCTDVQVASGANRDDLGDYRPGLRAAQERQVLHPFVEAGLGKPEVRALARHLGLTDVAELPAQPCLASRIETGLRVQPDDLAFIEETEREIRDVLGSAATLRCRIVADGVRIELGAGASGADLAKVRRIAEAACRRAGRHLLPIAPYRQGAAFVHDR